MTTFIYKAKKNTAETVAGEINAQTQEEAIDLINQLGLLPVSVKPQEAGNENIDLGRPRNVKSVEFFVFSRQLANLLKSGVAVLRALSIMEEQTSSPYFRKVIAAIVQGIKHGKSLSECLEEFPHIFSSLYITMVRAGEEGSNLQDMLVSVSIYQRRQEEIRGKVRMALAYPVFMAAVGLLTVYFILTFVLPKMFGLFDSIGEALPLPTVILLKISGFLNQGGLWWLVIGAVGCLLFGRWAKGKAGRSALSQVLLKIPMLGDVLLKTELSRFSRTLVLLLQSDVSIIKALQISIPILSNELVKKHLYRCQEALETGSSFGESLREAKEMPSMMGHLISVGEESGNLTEVLTEIAETYEQETDESIKMFTTLLEPVMILLVGLVIGFIVFAMLLPIFQVDILSR